MAQRLTKANVEARFEACVRMAQRVGIDTKGWHLWRQYENHWCATTESGEGIFGSGSTFAAGNRQAYDVMEGWLKAMQRIDNHFLNAITQSTAYKAKVTVAEKYGIVADFREILVSAPDKVGTVDVRL